MSAHSALSMYTYITQYLSLNFKVFWIEHILTTETETRTFVLDFASCLFLYITTGDSEGYKENS